jgi:hypothetical protein
MYNVFTQPEYVMISKRVCTMYVLFSTVHLQSVLSSYSVHLNWFVQQPGSAGSPESGPAADSKSINSIHSNHVPVLFSPLTAGAAGSAGAASGGGGAGSGAAGRSSNTAPAQKERQKVFTLHLGTSASANSLDDPLSSYGSVVVKDVLW